MFSRVSSVLVQGIRGCLVRVEANVCDGLPNFIMVGYLSGDLKEAKERVQTAMRNSGYYIPPRHITVNLSPADVRKEGSAYDLAIAVSILAATGFVHNEELEEYIIIGELSLNGHINQVRGIMPMVLCGREAGFRKCIVPLYNCREAMLVEGMEVYGGDRLDQIVEFLNSGDRKELPDLPEGDSPADRDFHSDFSDICGQEAAKRAAEVAASGMHNLLLSGPPGSGKSMIARHIPAIMPDLSYAESLEITKIYSVSGMLNDKHPLVSCRPFRAPHHTVTGAGLIGGGRIPKPGEISFAHHGVLFLDELPEYRRGVLQLLRQPMEDHAITLVRNDGVYEYPADFMLVAAMNPCPCGYYPDRSKCTCSLHAISQYQNKISHALLDRIDMKILVARVPYEQLRRNEKTGDTSGQIRERVQTAAELQEKRFIEEPIRFNSQMNGTQIKKYCSLSFECEDMLKEAFYRMGLSARGLHRTLKVARTIADTEASASIQQAHVMEALSYRLTSAEMGG